MKHYLFEVTETDDKHLHFKGECDGFHSLEVFGFLAYKLEDIRRQIAGDVKPDFEKRVVHKPQEAQDSPDA